jgi:hypothetical protein
MNLVKNKLPLLAFLFALLSVNNESKAQASANTTLNVVLTDVRSIKVNPAQTTVSLNFANAADYQNGVVNTQPSHLEITSTNGYVVKVKSASANLVNGTNNIPVNTITLMPNVTAGNSGGSGTVVISLSSASITPVNLSPTPTTIISSPTGQTKVFYDMKYGAQGGSSYINKAAGTYSTTITYTIEPL